MTAATRKKSTGQLFKECFEVMESKGVDYASKEDSLANFKRNAKALGLSKYQILLVYLNKHLDSINNAVKYHPGSPRTETVSEPLRGRVIDAINYMTILINMMEEDEGQQVAGYGSAPMMDWPSFAGSCTSPLGVLG